ncbi:MAG: hypothetical protein K2G74_01505 [Muribaculaceae bacterium]|nr:hypothetical protein [Muribaculaceae bacterium]
MDTPVKKEICKQIIGVFNKRDGKDYDFDSHEFISILKLCYPEEYYSKLLDYIPAEIKEKAFQQMHSHIGLQLSRNSETLRICKAKKHDSPNYKGENSQNERWEKKS